MLANYPSCQLEAFVGGSSFIVRMPLLMATAISTFTLGGDDARVLLNSY